LPYAGGLHSVVGRGRALYSLSPRERAGVRG
jgi:hypothetical protein